MQALLDACAAWNRSPCPETWEAARGAALAVLRQSGELPRGKWQRSAAAHRLLEACGVSVADAFDHPVTGPEK